MRCPCYCGAEGLLVFMSCPSCGNVVLVCDEVGTVFPNPRDVKSGVALSNLEPSDLCPRCQQLPVAEYQKAAPDQIQALGFGPGEYE